MNFVPGETVLIQERHFRLLYCVYKIELVKHYFDKLQALI